MIKFKYLKNTFFCVLSFLIVCLLVVPLEVNAASESYTRVRTYSFPVVSNRDFLNFSVTDNYITSGYPESGTYQSYKVGQTQYGVYHVKYYFPCILSDSVEILGYDSFVFQSIENSCSMDALIYSTNGDFISNNLQIKNIQTYYEFDISGHTYKTDPIDIDVFIPYQRIGTFKVYPVIEFDLFVNLDHYSNNISDTITSVSVELNHYRTASSLIILYGGTYVSSGENLISNKLDLLISTLTSKFESLTSFLGSKFDALFEIMEDDQEELVNGFQGSGTDTASTNFDNSATNLHVAETQLTQITNTSVNNYTDFAFDTTVLTSLGASLVYVVTWFTNFWNIGGLYTALLNIGLALLVAFFILRLKGK